VCLSACSILRAKAAFKLLVAQYPNIAAKVFASSDRRLAALKRSFETIDNSGFWSLLEEYIALLVPTIESSLVLQGGDATLADVVYCRCRQYVRLLDANERTALNALERRWSQAEQQLLVTAFVCQPKYRTYAVQMSLSEDEISRFVLGYANHWDSRAVCGLEESSAVSVAAVVDAWCTGRGRLD
jgi:hypothetical protein